MKRIGILGGTFDPPHAGHLLIAEETRLALELAEIWFIPSYEPPHKNRAMMNEKHRIAMLKGAIADNPSFAINLIEIERSGKSYTIDTMAALHAMYPDTVFYFIIGADMVEYLPNWHRIDELIDLVQFAGVRRAGYNLETKYPVIEIDIPTFNVSSSMVRSRLKNKKTVRYLVPDSVETYIKELRLYED